MTPGAGPEFEGIKAKVVHVRSLGLIGAVLAGLTMLAALGFGLTMLFGKALFASLLVWMLWPVVFGPELTTIVFGAETVPFWKIFLLMVTGSVVAKMLRPAGWGR